MPKGSQKIENAIVVVDDCVAELVNHARSRLSQSVEWNGLTWQKELLSLSRRYSRAVDRLTRVRKVQGRKTPGLSNAKVPR